MTKIVDIEDIRKKREKKEIGIPIENINKKELKRRGHEIGDILGCDEKGEEICVRKGKGNLYVDGNMEKEQLFDFMRSQIYQNIQRGDSMVIVDLGSRIYKRELWIYLTIHGYRVDSYNMDCMTESDCFNCLDGLGAENEEQIVMIANDIIDDQKYKFMTYPVETVCKALLSAVLLASLTEMEESDRNMLEIATIFRLGVSGTMLDKILHVMFEELDETSSAKQRKESGWKPFKRLVMHWRYMKNERMAACVIISVQTDTTWKCLSKKSLYCLLNLDSFQKIKCCSVYLWRGYMIPC